MYAMGNMSKAKYIERIDIANERIQLLQEQLTNIQEKLDTIQGREIEIELIKGHYTLNKETNSYELKKLELDKQTLHRIIKSITVHKPIKKVQIIDIELTNSNTFQLIYDRNKRDYLLI
jgi:DNA-directed RNA polymerase subunit H (RpoH/RPB5)